ncbi:hypothetical protein ABE438_00860 [Bosea sp. TWI1241]|uniref:hypothetical protein n=1 Tax=Bosea sp. TWI1241 TaxID=3148904 RepID=UPI00320A6048
MAETTFDRLLGIYRNTTFAAGAREGEVTIVSEDAIALLREADESQEVANDTGLFPDVDLAGLKVGDRVKVEFRPPRTGIGLLVENFDALLMTPEARSKEPSAYFVIAGKLEPSTEPASDFQTRYRKAIAVVGLLSEAASYLDRTRQELVFFREGKFVVPIRYDAADLRRFEVADAERLLALFEDVVHHDQKLSILTEAVAHLTESQPAAARFAYLLTNVGTVADEVRDGYRLFASSFSYNRIRSEVEAAKLEFVAKIHKTFVDIQGQLLGIPVATVIVASQLKVANACGLDLWTNVAVLAGAWIFVLLLLLAIVNQWLTLTALKDEIDRQKRKLVSDYAAISDKFTPIFSGLAGRIVWHRIGLFVVAIVATLGVAFATFAYLRLTGVDPLKCLS